MKFVILGGTKGMGRALARRLADRGDGLFLLGRNADELQRSANDLELRGNVKQVETALCDLADPDQFEPALAHAWQSLGRVDGVVLSAATFAPQAELANDAQRCAQLLQINFSHSVLFCEAARRRLLDQGGGTLCVFSSVAGDRGRAPVAIYGATKAGLSCYLEALDHAYRRKGLKVVCVKPGFVHTDMTQGVSAPPFASYPEAIAPRIVRALDRGIPVVYAPWIWRWIMRIVRWLPRFILRRLHF